MKRLFSFRGRTSRSVYQRTWLRVTIIEIFLGAVETIIVGPAGLGSGLFSLLIFGTSLTLFEFYLSACQVRRCHDLNHSGWFAIIPFYGIWLLFASGTVGENRFDPPHVPDNSDPNVQPETASHPPADVGVIFLWILLLLLSYRHNPMISRTQYIEKGQMAETLLDGDCIVYHWFPFQTLFSVPLFSKNPLGDVVLFNHSMYDSVAEKLEKHIFIQRRVANPGDTIEIRDGHLFVNGRLLPLAASAQASSLPSPAVASSAALIFPPNKNWTADNFGPLYVPRKGDDIKVDSTNFLQWSQFIQEEKHTVLLAHDKVMIDGTPTTYYKVKNDYCFMLGDDRNNSEDSRYFGLIGTGNVFAGAGMIYWSWDTKHNSVRWNRMFHFVN